MIKLQCFLIDLSNFIPYLKTIRVFQPKSSMFDTFNDLIMDFFRAIVTNSANEITQVIDQIFFVKPDFFNKHSMIYEAWSVCRGIAISMVILIILLWALKYMLKPAFPDVPRATQFFPRMFVGIGLIWNSYWIVSTAIEVFRWVYDTILSFFSGISLSQIYGMIELDNGILALIFYIFATILGVIFIFQCLIRLVASAVSLVTSPFAFLAWLNPASKPLFDGWIKFTAAILFSWILNIIVIIIICAIGAGTGAIGLTGIVSKVVDSLLMCAGLYFLTKTNKYCQEFVGAWGTQTSIRQGATNIMYMAKNFKIPLK